MMKTVVILPTYNEADNLSPLVEAIFRHLPDAAICVVDDHSPDGTGRIADQLANRHPGRIRVLHRHQKQGLGMAYRHAFEELLKTDVSRVIQMDADFSHPPEVLPKLAAALDSHDFVLGSRYVPGGGVRGWSLFRRWVSVAGNHYARWMLKLPIRDLTGGFKAFNRRVLEYLATCPVDSVGYNFQIETTARSIARGFSCVEIPFYFEERKTGVSKMSKGIIWEASVKTFRLRRSLKKENHNRWGSEITPNRVSRPI